MPTKISPLSNVNYQIHTDAVKQHLVPPKLSVQKTNNIYANEADVLNIALFGMTAREWRNENTGKEGNIRDYATVEQLVVLINLESLNAQYITEGMSQNKRLVKLNQIAINQMKALLNNQSVKKIGTVISETKTNV